MGKSNYTGNEDSYTQASDPDAASSVDRGALSRQLSANAMARAAAANAPKPSRDFDDVMPVSDAMEAANSNPDLSPVGPRVTPASSVQAAPVKRPVSVAESLSSDESVMPSDAKRNSLRAHANLATDRANAFGQRGLDENGMPIQDMIKMASLQARKKPNPKLNSLRATRSAMMGMKEGGSTKNYCTPDGKINLGQGRVSTASKGKKNAAW